MIISPGPPDEDAAELVQDYPNLASRKCVARCAEPIWWHHEFRLRAHDIEFPVAQAQQSLVEWVADRREERNPALLYTNLGGGQKSLPCTSIAGMAYKWRPANLTLISTIDGRLWSHTSYEQQVPSVPDAMVRWSRSGRTWSSDEVISLRERLNALWDARWGRREQGPLTTPDGRPVLFAA